VPRAGLTRGAVVELALAVVDEGGPTGFDQLTLAAVAARAGVAVPSLYKHVAGLPDLRREVALVAVRGLTAALGEASGPHDAHDALSRTAHAVRGFARRHPGRYAATQVAPDPASPDDAELVEANAEAVRATAVALGPLIGPLTGPDLVHTVRAVRSAVHGFVTLEQRGGFGLPEDVDASFDHLLAILERGLPPTPGDHAPHP
jgi:AcrR family transcriptional regulator